MIADRMMQADADGDGKVSKAEASGGNAQRMFDQADADGDGFITRVEIITFIQSRSGNRGGGRGEDMARPGGDRAGGDRAGSPAAAKPVDPKEAFHEAMEASGRALRGLRRAKFDAISKETDLAAIRTIQSSLMIAKQHTAAIPMSDAAKEKFGTDAKAYQMAFQIDMIKAIMGTFQVEMAVLQGDAEKAKAAAPGIWKFLQWNPLLQTIDSLRQVTLWGGELDWWKVGYAWVFGVIVFLGGAWFFNRLRPAFADVL